MRILITGNGSGLGAAMEKELSPKHTIYGTHDAKGKRRMDLESGVGRILLWQKVPKELDVLINNAGILDEEEFGSLTSGAMSRVFFVNAILPLLLAQEAHKRGVHTIINVGSLYGISGTFGRKPTYAASKAALHNATLSLARILAPDTRVIGIAPGIIPTGIHDSQGGTAKHGTGHALLNRVGTPEEIATFTRFLIEEAHYTTGTVIECGGGR